MPQHEISEAQIAAAIGELFHDRLIDSISDGVLYTDANFIVTAWNFAAEKMTGLKAETILDQIWDPKIIKMRHAEGRFVSPKSCPFRKTLETGLKSQMHVSIRSTDESTRQIDLCIDPVIDDRGMVHGLSLIHI